MSCETPQVEIFERIARMEAEVGNLKAQNEQILGALTDLAKEFREFKDKVLPLTRLESRVESLEATLNVLQGQYNKARGGWLALCAAASIGAGLFEAIAQFFHIFHK